MGWCLSPPLGGHEEHRERSTIKRFDARFWTVDFPRPMMGSVVSDGAEALRVDLAFTGKDNLAGLIWEAEDRWDHPLLAYETRRDFRRCVLRFRWRSGGVKPLDAVWGPVLTIEGRDESGAARAWFVRLWNYAVGSPGDAVVTLDFGAINGGFLLPGEADPVWAGDVDRMMISLVPPDYDGSAGDYAAMADGWVELTGMQCDGSGSVLAIGDAMLPEHSLSMATAYDDAYNQTPARLLRQVEALGYRGPLLHYVGMSHFMRLTQVGGDWLVSVSGGALCGPALAWHEALVAEALAQGRAVIWSLSYELFADYCPQAWMQRAADGGPALTGWVPPSALLSPANAEAMGWLALVARVLVGIAKGAGMAVHFQVGEPWWWVTADRRPCLYDSAATSALGSASVAIPDLGAALNAAQKAMLDAAGALLAQSTAALCAAVRDEAGDDGATTYLLAYLPTLLDPMMPEARRMMMPTGWAKPAFDVLQLEDYDWASRGQVGASVAGIALAEARLGYPAAEQHYLAGFVLTAADRAQWEAIDAAAMRSVARGVAATFIWALPQVARDGFLHFEEGEGAVDAFDDVDFPLALGREASVVAEFSTAIVTGQSGAEQRAPDWDNARLRYDAGPGIRSEADVRVLVDFYRARRGPAVGFRFRDPFDASSAVDGGAPGMADQTIGTGDGVRTDFPLTKSYGNGAGAARRRITRPVVDSVLVSVNGVAASGWTLGPLGMVSFAVPPASGAEIRAGFLFDVPVRFAEDRLEVSRATWLAGEIATVPLIEVREG
ncbi:DUF2460 domain-containing protein [Sphingomonas lacunae]|uniref:DUF2460 domain-containing protein n=1 Tax=Sphingomonas lacunae TaxID=2698828 RepID=A0A6M4ATF0_9SPHN|nr:DUF2460 domain-containing protein [Sphingomonas lacunae]QJQ32388.1 DUF2460 domain-containing protein [Sphingomonas lacunae]